MSELSKLFGKAEEVEINGLKFKIKPLTVADLDLVGGIDPDKPSVEALKGLVKKVLMDSFPDATDDEVNQIPLDVVSELSEHVARVNKFKTDKGDAEAKIIERIKAKRVGTA